MKEDIEFMEDPELWPRWPFLPVKRYVDRRLQSGVMIAEDGRRTNVYKANVYVAEQLGTVADDTAEKTVYDSFKAIVEDGWRVD